METKICKRCEQEKNINDYRKRKVNNKIYISNICICCENKANTEYIKNRYYKNNKDKILEYQKKYREENKEKLKEYFKENYQKNKKQKLKYSIKYQKEHKEQRNERERIKKENNKVYSLKCSVRKMINRSFNRKQYVKSNNCEEILGLKIENFINYLLNTFKINYGYEWDGIEKVHIDHVIPLATAKTEKEVIELCYYTNLQLLKAKDNLEKGCKLDFDKKEN